MLVDTHVILLGERFTFVTITPHLASVRVSAVLTTHLVTDGRGHSWNRCTRLANPLRFLSRSRAAGEEVHDHRNDGEKQQDVN